MVSEKSRYFLRAAVQITFLTVFVFLLLSGLSQFWLVIFGVGVVVSMVFDRFYCGWICPMGTLARPIGWMYSKLGKDRKETPALLKKGWGRWTALAALILVIFYLRAVGAQLPVFLFVTLIGVGFFLVLEEEAFHKQLCPYGAILSVSSRPDKFGMSVDKSICTGCGRCQEVCPNNTIDTLYSGARKIENKECLVCFRCEDICTVDAIEYGDAGGKN